MKKFYYKVLSIYKGIEPPVKASFWFTFSNILQKGIALASMPIMTKILSKEQYGTFMIYQSWYSIIIIFATVNLFLNAYTKGLVQFESDQKRFTSSFLGLTSSISIILFAILFLNLNYFSELFNLSPLLLIFMFFDIFFISAYEFWAASQRFEYKYRKLVVVSIVMSVGSLLLAILSIISTPYKVEARVLSDVIVKCLIGASLYLFLFHKGRTLFDFKYWKYGLLFNLPLIPHFLSHFILIQSDRIMIGRLVGNEEAAIYGIAYAISMMMLLVTNAINSSFTPFTYKKMKVNDINSIRKYSKLLFILVATLCTLTMLFSPEIVLIFAGREYYDAIWTMPPISASVFFIFLYSMFSNIEYYYKKTMLISLASFICAILNIISNFIFIPLFGYYAAGYTTLIAYICLATMHYIFYKKIIKKELESKEVIYDVKIIVICAFSVIIMMGIMIIAYSSLILRYGLIVIIVFAICYNWRKIISMLNLNKMEIKESTR